MQAGADLCINSTHKMLGSLSQTAMMHVQGNRIRLDRLKAVYKLFLSTSPNLVLVASLDVARRQMALDGPALLSRTIEIANDARARLNEIPRVYCFGEELEGRPGVFDLDPTKITITVKDLGYTGYEAEEILRRRYNVQVELADLFNVVALYTIGTTPEASDQLIRGVSELAREDRPLDIFSPSGVLDRRMKTGTYKLPPIPPIRLVPRDAFLADTEFVPFKRSAGRICAEVITPYPPGIPVHLAGRGDHAGDHRLPAAREARGREDARPLRRRAQVHPRRALRRSWTAALTRRRAARSRSGRGRSFFPCARTSRSTPAATSRSATAGLSSRWSIRSPASRPNALRK